MVFRHNHILKKINKKLEFPSEILHHAKLSRPKITNFHKFHEHIDFIKSTKEYITYKQTPQKVQCRQNLIFEAINNYRSSGLMNQVLE